MEPERGLVTQSLFPKEAVFSTFGYWWLFALGRSLLPPLKLVVALLSYIQERWSLAITITSAITIS
jgi:hypothetical protein